MSEFTFKDACAYINATPILQSLLYDLNRLPEQVVSSGDSGRQMMLIVVHWREAEYQRRREVEPYAMALRDALSNVRGLLVAYFCGEREKDHYVEEAMRWCDSTLASTESTEARTKTPPSSVNDGARLSPNEVAAQSGPACRAAQAVEARQNTVLTGLPLQEKT